MNDVINNKNQENDFITDFLNSLEEDKVLEKNTDENNNLEKTIKINSLNNNKNTQQANKNKEVNKSNIIKENDESQKAGPHIKVKTIYNKQGQIEPVFEKMSEQDMKEFNEFDNKLNAIKNSSLQKVDKEKIADETGIAQTIVKSSGLTRTIYKKDIEDEDAKQRALKEEKIRQESIDALTENMPKKKKIYLKNYLSSILSYLTWIGWFIAFFFGNKKKISFYLNQALTLNIMALLPMKILFNEKIATIWEWFILILLFYGLIGAILHKKNRIPLLDKVHLIK